MTPIEEIKSKIGIIDVASQYIRVEKSGAQYKARCPFHNEKTPSFYLSPSRNTYHCFGCGVSGDIFKFVEAIEHIEFKEALKILAERADVKLEYKKNEENAVLLSLLADASLFFQINLKESLEAKKYLHDRGLIDETISDYNIGYGKNDWRTLFVYLATKGYSPEEMVEAGLVIASEGGKFYDRFRGRIMFPIKNISGAVVGFTGRVLPAYDDGKSGKYVNTPETKLYHKSKILFNYDKAKKYIAESREVILAEGQMDVIMSYQAGIKNIIAVSGTAFTEEQVKMINRLADNVVLAFDNDNAGKKASDRAAIMCAYGGMQISTVNILEKDIADIVFNSPNNWLEIYKNKIPIINTYADNLLKLESQNQKVQYIKTQVAPYLRAVQSPIEKDFTIKDFSRLTNISAEAIKEELSKNMSTEQIKELENRENKSEEQNKIASIKNKNNLEDLSIEIFILKRELKINDNIKLKIAEDELPNEIYNSRVMQMEKEMKLNRAHYNAVVDSYILKIFEDAGNKIKNNKDLIEEQKLTEQQKVANLKNKYSQDKKIQLAELSEASKKEIEEQKNSTIMLIMQLV